MSQESRSIKSMTNIVWGIVFRMISMLFPFLIKTIIIQTLGAQYLGLNSLFTSVLSMLALSELGIGSALVYSMYKPIAAGDTKLVCALLNAYKKVYRIIGVVVFCLGMALMPFLKHFISGSYPAEVNIYLLYFIYLCNTILSYTFFSYKSSLLEASQKNSVESMLHSVTNLLMYGFQIVALLYTHNYYAYLIVMPLTTLLLNLIRSHYVDKHYPEYKCENNLDKGELKAIFKKVRALVGHKIGTTVITSADSIVISSFLGLDILAIYGNYYMIINSLLGLVTIFYTAITASVGNSLITDTRERIYTQFTTLNFLNEWIVSWCTVCLLCLYQPFMRLWMGEKMLFKMGTVVLLCIYFYTWLVRRIGLTYKDAAGMWEDDFWKPYVGIIVNICGNIVLVLAIGVNGVIISTILVMVGVYFPWETYILRRKLFKRSLKNYILKIGCNMLLTIAVCWITQMICSFVVLAGWKGLIFRGIICLIIPNILYLAVYCRSREFKDSYDRLRELLRQCRV